MAYHFGWSIEYCVQLTPIQMSLIMDGLGEILKQKYDPNHQEESKEEIEKKLLEIRIKREKELKDKKGSRKNIKPKSFKLS